MKEVGRLNPQLEAIPQQNNCIDYQRTIHSSLGLRPSGRHASSSKGQNGTWAAIWSMRYSTSLGSLPRLVAATFNSTSSCDRAPISAQEISSLESTKRSAISGKLNPLSSNS